MNIIATSVKKDNLAHPLCKAFMKWQCRVRQMAMRQMDGRPNDSIRPDVYLSSDSEPLIKIVTLINKLPKYSATAEFKYMSARTFDPAERRRKAIEFLSSSYYQNYDQFSDILTATFSPDSKAVTTIRRTQLINLIFNHYGQTFNICCKVWHLAMQNYLYQSTIAHNHLFNPKILPNTIVLAFEPDWTKST